MLTMLRRLLGLVRPGRDLATASGPAARFASAHLAGLQEPEPDALPAWIWRRPKEHVLYLSIDGVLHPGASGSFARLYALEMLLRLFPDVDVLIASGPRDEAANRAVIEAFSPDLAPRLCGTTRPTPPGAAPLLGRHLEILRSARQLGVRRFVALDAPGGGYPDDCDYLIATDAAEGVTDATLHALGRVFVKWFPRAEIVWPDQATETA